MRMSRSAAVLAGAAASLLLVTSPAWAHVTVNSPGATQGGFAELSFRVPTEEDVPTTKVEVAFPANAPLAFVSVKPHAGWKYDVTKVKAPAGLKSDDGPVDQVVSRITWTATAGGIKPGEYDDFDVSVGPLPKVDQMVFKALQTYSNGKVVRWIELPVAGQPEPDHPAPILDLAKATDETGATGSPSAAASPSVSASPVATTTKTASSSDDTGRALGGAGLAVGALALLLGLVALARTRRA